MAVSRPSPLAGGPPVFWKSCSVFADTSGGGTIVLGPDESEDGEGLPVTGVTNARGYRNLRQ